jgi:DNA-directed RNA polymerase specialized sigma subunit
MSDKARGMVKKGSVEEAAVLGNLGLIYQRKRDIKNFLTKRLTRDERLIIVLYYYEEMTMKEIGATLDLSESRVSQMHSSIVARMKAQINSRRRKFLSIE